MSKTTYPYLLLLFSVSVLVMGFFELNKQVIKAELVWGSGRGPDSYYIFNSQFEEISSNLEQINTLQDDPYVNINYVVVYRENKWLQNQKEALKLIRFERPFPVVKKEDPANSKYYKLVKESVHSVDQESSIFIRLYEKYEVNHNLFGLEPVPFIIPQVHSLQEARALIQSKEPDLMRLLPLTVVDEAVIDQWSKDNYLPKSEYSSQSPEGLTVKAIIETNQ
jgi:hypothetical protein